MAFLKLLRLRTHRTLEENRELWKDLLGMAQVSIRIVGGELNSEFYEDPGILHQFEKAAERGVLIEIIHGPDLDPKTKKLCELARDERVTLYRLEKRPASHFMVVDEKHAEVEDFHVPSAGERQTFTKYDTLFLAQRLSIEFAKLKAQAKPHRREE